MKTALLAATTLVVAAASTASAATIAYYRFEEGPDGGFLTAVDGQPTTSVTADSTGNAANALRTFNAPANPNQNFDTSPRYRAGLVPAPVVPQTGAANNFSFDFDGNDDIYPASFGSAPINSTFDDGNQFTIEAFVNTRVTDSFDTFVGRDDFAGESADGGGAAALFYLQLRQGGRFAAVASSKQPGLQAEIETGSGFVQANRWYHLAVVGDGTDMDFYVDGALIGSAPLPGGLTNSASNAGWTVGRGFFNNNVTDWVEGLIDEVRFSDTALAPSQFLNAVIPEPATLGLLAGAGLLALRRRK